MQCRAVFLECLVCRRIFSRMRLRPGVRVVGDGLASWCARYVSISSVDQLRGVTCTGRESIPMPTLWTGPAPVHTAGPASSTS